MKTVGIVAKEYRSTEDKLRTSDKFENKRFLRDIKGRFTSCIKMNERGLSQTFQVNFILHLIC